MFALLVELTAQATAVVELEGLLAELAAGAAQEDGILVYAVNRQQEDPARFVLYELYRDRSAWEAHVAREPVARALKRFDELLAMPPRVVFCDPLALAGPAWGTSS